MAQLIPSTIPVRVFEDHEARVSAVAVFPDKRRMVTCSYDATLRLWDLTTGVVLKKMEGHRNRVQALVVSRDGRFIASGDTDGELIAWDGETGESLIQAISAHTGWILSLDFSSDSKVLASGSSDPRLYREKYSHYNPLKTCDDFNSSFKAQYKAAINDTGLHNCSLAWTSNGCLLTGGDYQDPNIRVWTYYSSRQRYQVDGNPMKGHFESIRAISLNYNDTLLTSASDDKHVRVWRLSDRRIVSVFKHSGEVNCVTFSADGRHILSGGADKKILEWPASGDRQMDGLMKEQVTPPGQAYFDFKVLAINTTVRNAWIAGDFPTAEKVLNAEIGDGRGGHTSYAHRALIMARKLNWDHALHDAIRSVNIQPSLAGHIAKGIALCGKKWARVARTSFDLASIFTDGDLKTDHFLFFVKTIALFNANEHEEAMLRVGELAACPNADPIACHVVEAYLRVQLGNIALAGMRHNEAVDHFTAAVNASTFFYQLEIHSMYEEFVVLFGWDLKSL